MSLLLLLKGGQEAVEPARLHVRESMPMRQTLIATAPSGKPYRWSEDGTSPDQALEDLNDSGSVPGGNQSLTVTLPRKLGVDYGDMKRGTRIEVMGAGRMKLGEYELQRAPKVSGDKLSVSPAAAGYEGHLVGDNTAQEIFIDAEIGAWGETSAQRRAQYPQVKHGNSQVQVLPAGTPDPANLEAFSSVPAVSHSWTNINNNGMTQPDVAESWYDSLGVQIGKLMFDFAPVAGITSGDVNWADHVWSSPDAVGNVAIDLLVELDATPTVGKTLDVPAGRYYLLLEDYLQTTFNAAGKWEVQWKNLRVFGRHGLPVHGAWPAIGLLASDIIAYALGRWAPTIHYTTGPHGTIRPTQFLIPHLVFKEPANVAEMIQRATRFELPEWGVWPGQHGPTFHLNRRGEREGRKRWRACASQVEFEDTGQQMDQVWNGVMVLGKATDGSTLFVGPTGCGLRYTSDRCLDEDPQNPANEAGIKRYAKIQMKGVATMAGMLETAEAFLEESKLLDGSGKATLTGYVEDEHGMEWPYYCVEAGDLIDLRRSSIPGYRYIVNASRTRSSRSVSIDIDAPPDNFEAMMERLYAEYIGIGLESG